MRKAVVVMSVVLGSLAFAPSAGAVIPSVFGGDVACTPAADGVRECGNTAPRSTTNETFDGVPLDINVAFPPDPGGTDGPYPLIVWGHGYGGAKIGFGASGSASGMRRFTSRGYAVMSMTTRGFRESCGSAAAQTAGGAACNNGFVRLMDTRYEVRDYQDLAGELVEDSLVVPTQIGAVGGSYGGGLSMALGALKDRQMMTDGSLVPWVSPDDGIAMTMAAAVPNIPWSDLAYSLVPNGHTLDYTVDNDYGPRFGVMKRSLVNGLYLSGQIAPGFYAPVGTPSADLTGWLARLQQGEPYEGDPTATSILDDIKANHSSFYIDSSVAPVPMLMSSGFTDDLFPADETIRFWNRTRVQHPGTPISLFFGDFGHQRSGNKSDVRAALEARENEWLDFYVLGAGSTPPQGVTAYTQTCPSTSDVPSEGPFTADNWAAIAPGELRLNDGTTKTITAASGDSNIAPTFDPAAAGNGGACNTTATVDEPGTAAYSLPAVTQPTTLMGATSVIAEFGSGNSNNGMAARLLDVLPSGEERLVARALFRPEPGISKQVFQLHPNGYTFQPGSVPRLQLLAKDSGGSPLNTYGRPADGQGDLTVSNLEVRLPVTQKPGAGGGAVKVPRDEFVPAGRTLHPDFAALQNKGNATIADGTLNGTKTSLNVTLGSPGTWVACHATVEVYSATPPAGTPPPVATTAGKKGKGKGKKGKKKKKKKKKKKATAGVLLGTGKATITGGQTGAVTIALNQAGKNIAKKGKQKNLIVRVATVEQDGFVQAERKAQFKNKKKKKKKKKKGKGKKKK